MVKSNTLTFSYLDKNQKKIASTFEPEEGRLFKIGRKSTNDIVLDKNFFSRVHSSFYCENGKWYVQDGDGENESTNGTWIMLDEELPIVNDMELRVGINLLKITSL